jgi:citrate lyase beta subunit
MEGAEMSRAICILNAHCAASEGKVVSVTGKLVHEPSTEKLRQTKARKSVSIYYGLWG